ncbi:alpha/beta fold hydrolase [Actinopolymorpha singaporensis]|nr:alpha/beta hydrolase [Actinopolymorpha singaporensis]
MTIRWERPGPARGRILLVHGELSQSSTWWRVGPALADQGWQVSTVDLPGHGDMPHDGRPLDLPTLVQGVAEHLPGRVDVIAGHGLGAVVALALANRFVDLAQAVVMEEPLSSREEDRGALVDAVVAATTIARSDLEHLELQLRTNHPQWNPEDVAHATEAIAAAEAEQLLAGLRRPRPWDLPALLGTLRIPALLLVAPDEPHPSGTGRLSTLRGLDRLAAERCVPAERFVVLPGGHHLHRDVPERWLQAVTRFADEVCPPRED